MKRLLTLLLLLAPSVLAQNPVSGGPIPQSTYTTPSTIGGGGGGASYGLGSGTAQAQIIASPSPTIGALTNGVQVCWLPVAANTAAAPTLQVGTLAAKPITKYGTVALVANDITTAGIACAIYDGTEFQMQVPLAGGAFSGSLNIGSGASAAGATATGGFAAVEAASTGWTPTVGQDYMRADSTAHAFLCSWNGAAEALCGGAAFPLTVTGGVSGGIPYFSSTTVESASPILNTGFLMKGGGAGSPPTNSLCDEGATSANTLTCTDTAGLAIPKIGTGGNPPACAVATSAWCGAESVSPTLVAGVDDIHPDTTNHCEDVANGLAENGCIVGSSQTIVTIGSGADIPATSLCSTVNCPVGTYRVNVYIDMSTPCGTTGTFIAWLGYTDDSGARTGSSTTTFFDIQGTGSVPSTGTLTTTSTANFGQATYILRTTGAATGGLGSINYGATRTACGTAGPMVGKMYLAIERIGFL